MFIKLPPPIPIPFEIKIKNEISPKIKMLSSEKKNCYTLGIHNSVTQCCRYCNINHTSLPIKCLPKLRNS